MVVYALHVPLANTIVNESAYTSLCGAFGHGGCCGIGCDCALFKKRRIRPGEEFRRAIARAASVDVTKVKITIESGPDPTRRRHLLAGSIRIVVEIIVQDEEAESAMEAKMTGQACCSHRVSILVQKAKHGS